MIPVKITKRIYIRKGPGRQYASIGDIMPSGKAISMEGTETGENYKGVSSWYYLTNSNGVKQYYWGGGVEKINVIPQAPTPAPEKATQAWFSDKFLIPKIWQDFGVRGEKVTVAVLDTGYDAANDDLSAGVAMTSKFITYGESANDIDGHGTECASILGCRNTKSWNIGVAPQCSLLIGKISNKGELNDFDGIIAGIGWALDHGAEIISLSFGKFTDDVEQISSLYDAIESKIADRNILIFTLSGNNYSPTPTSGILYPAALSAEQTAIGKPALSKIISIGAIDNTGNIASITLLNDYTTLHCPGIDIQCYKLNNEVVLDMGTSLATPIAAGVAALAVSYLKKTNNGAWNADDLREKIYASGDPIPGTSNKYVINPQKLFSSL